MRRRLGTGGRDLADTLLTDAVSESQFRHGVGPGGVGREDDMPVADFPLSQAGRSRLDEGGRSQYSAPAFRPGRGSMIRAARRRPNPSRGSTGTRTERERRRS